MKLSLKALRANKDMTQAEASKRLGVNPGTLSRWESGKSYPSITQIKKIEELYDVESVSYTHLTLPTKRIV